MNFKDIYGGANDELHGNPEVLRRLLTQKQKKRKNIMPLFVSFAAAAAVAAVLIVRPGTVGVDKSLKPDSIRIASVVPEAETDIKEQEIPYQPDVQNAARPELNAGSSQPAAEEAATPPEVSALLQENEELPEEVPEITIEAAPYVSELKINSVEQLAGAEGSVMTARLITEQKEMTAEEYAEYIGKDIPSLSSVPEGFEFLEPGSVMADVDDDGSIIKEKGIYFAHSADYERFAEISVSKTGNIAIGADGFEVSEIGGNQIIVLSDGTDYNASFADGDVQYFVRTCGMSQQELENLLISLNGGNKDEQEDIGRNDGGDDGSVVDDGNGGGQGA